MQVFKLAMIGCGRAAESLHLPSAAVCGNVETSVLVDTDVERARALADAYGVAEVRGSVAEAVQLAQAAVVALPHHLHAPVTRELLEAGLHVLVEKPLALTSRECEELADLAQRKGLTLAVGMIRRSFPAARFVKQLLERDLLGTVQGVELREGAPFSWDVATDFTFRRETGGGVLADAGVHVLDLLDWWFGELSVEAYRDDARGGVEAEAELELSLAEGAPVAVELSRTRELSNRVTIWGSRGTVSAGTGFSAEVELDLGDDPLVGSVRPREREFHNVRELFALQLEEFGEAISAGRPPRVGASEAMRAVKLLEECRARREELRLPWTEFRGHDLGAGVAA